MSLSLFWDSGRAQRKGREIFAQELFVDEDVASRKRLPELLNAFNFVIVNNGFYFIDIFPPDLDTECVRFAVGCPDHELVFTGR